MTTEQRLAARTNRLAVWALLLLALVAALPALAALPARARANAGYLHLNRGQAGGEPAELARATSHLAEVSPSPIVGQRAWRGLGLTAMMGARDDEAIAAWQRVDGGAAELALWGYQAESAGDWAAARARRRLAVRLDPDDGDAWYEVARTSTQLGDAAAAQEYRQALAAARHARFGPSNILTRLGELAKNAAPPDWAAALAHFEDALQRDDFIVADDRLQAHLGRAEALDKLGQTAAALDAYRQVAAGWPNHYWANVHSGRLTWYVETDAPRAAAFLNHAIGLRPDDKWAYLFLGGIYAEAGQADLAGPLLRRVLEIDPADATARKQLDQLTDGDGS